jgi:LysM repeat protein
MGYIMTTENELHDNESARSVLAGLVPAFDYAHELSESPREHSAFTSGVLNTMPILLASSLAVTMTLAGSVPSASARSAAETRNDASRAANLSTAKLTAASAATTGRTAVAPSVYKVVAGDTISKIAGRFGLSTASVLALNGLGWKSLIFPGQSLRLTTAPVAAPQQSAPIADSASTTRYTIVAGDTISTIAARFGVSIQSVLTANGLSWSTIIYPRQVIRIPDAANTPSTPPTPSTDDATQSPSDAETTPPVAGDANAPQPVAEVAPVAEAAPPAVETAPEASTPAPAPAPAPVVAPPAASGTNYVIQSGDSLSRIASLFGVTVAALRTANNLGTSSTIYVGRTLVIPGVTVAAGATDPITLLSAESQAQARTIISVGRSLGVSDYGIVIALAAAMQESSMRNINYGHLDSVGLFQQRPASGWGTVAQLTTPEYAARLFYGGPSNPNAGKTRGLLDIAGWSSMSVTVAAQRVQISAYPDAYAKWEASARYWLATL